LEVKMILLVFMPLTTNVPFTCNDFPLLNFTTTPGSIVSVTPLLTNTFPVTIYGLPASVHVVLAEIIPLTVVPPDVTPTPVKVTIEGLPDAL
jgi:hypothetical protein